jgi:hypothetical protein
MLRDGESPLAPRITSSAWIIVCRVPLDLPIPSL